MKNKDEKLIELIKLNTEKTLYTALQHSRKLIARMIHLLDLKWAALFALILQNAGLAILMRYTFLLAASNPSQRYIASTAVLLSEVVKLIIATIACYSDDSHGSFEQLKALLYLECVDNYKDFLKLCVPSLLYTIQVRRRFDLIQCSLLGYLCASPYNNIFSLQNSLQYFSMSCLSAPVFQVLYQMKIITTAIFSVILLSKRISSLQWVS